MIYERFKIWFWKKNGLDLFPSFLANKSRLSWQWCKWWVSFYNNDYHDNDYYHYTDDYHDNDGNSGT